MKVNNFQKGRRGENIAKNFLEKKGYKLICQNFQNRFGQIDLIMAYQKVLIFVEVKLKIGKDYGLPEEMINKRKIKRIENQANAYLAQNPLISAKYPQKRIDAVCILMNKNNQIETIKHYQNITVN